MDYAIYTVVFKNGKYKDKETKVLANEDILNYKLENKQIKAYKKAKQTNKTIRSITHFFFYSEKSKAIESSYLNNKPQNTLIQDILNEYSDRIETTVKYFKNKKRNESDKIKIENLSDVLNQFNSIESNTEKEENEEKEYKTKHSHEGRRLKECLLKYIKDLVLKEFNFNNLTDEQIYSISTYGDTLFSIDLKNNGIIDSHKNFLITNETMKYSLYFLGFKEVYSYPTHFAGTLFETLYALSIIQGNFELRSMLFGYLTKEELKMDLINEILKIGEEMNK